MKRDILKEYVTLRSSLEQERHELQARLSKLEAALGAPAPLALAGLAADTRAKPRRKVSAAGRRAIAAAARARWAKVRAGKPGRPVAGRKVKGKLSAAGRAAIIAGQKARWARLRAGKAGRLGVTTPRAAAGPKKKFSAVARA